MATVYPELDSIHHFNLRLYTAKPHISMIHTSTAKDGMAWYSNSKAYRQDENDSCDAADHNSERMSLNPEIGIGYKSHDAEGPPRPSFTVEVFERDVPPAIAKLLNPEIIIHMDSTSTQDNTIKMPQRVWKPDTPDATYDHQIPRVNQTKRKPDVDATAHDNHISAEHTTASTKRKSHPDIDEAIPDNQVPSSSTVAVVDRSHDDDATEDCGIDSANKLKKPKLIQGDTSSASLASPPPTSPELLTPPEAPTKTKKRPKVKWTEEEEVLLKKGFAEGLGWQAIARKYLPTRDRSGCYLHWQSMQAKTLPPRRDWTVEENEKLTKAIKARSKETRELWSKVAEDVGKGRTWKEVEMQQAHLIVKEKEKKKN
ncbi:hypothetical protein BC936DRAFT_145818 [Jimgerdemannia flammicorona]|uniref:Uncharacterized protein n=2 Tax=Jimgerdemannia flammicorona TaxID=994334 RepID=A0A433QXP6_9FUNG|nr:hypothetical protein BC936DRAFT_145818 [Jimgerdemannia flammicorona]RUS34593.1 hypothetical protein BC938DRAFT_479571 [Jimgerdemannia flammicorona]